jgi:hypothetical protein
MQSDKHSLKELLLITKSMSTKLKRDKLKNYFSNMIDPFWLLTQEDANLRNTEALVQEQDIKNLIDDGYL